MAYDDQRGRTSDFSGALRLPGPQSGGTPNYAPDMQPQFLGGSGGFMQAGGNGGGFTNFSAYLMANPGAGGDADASARTPGMSALDSALNVAYGHHTYGSPANSDGGAPAASPAGTPSSIPPAMTPPVAGNGAGGGGGLGSPPQTQPNLEGFSQRLLFR